VSRPAGAVAKVGRVEEMIMNEILPTGMLQAQPVRPDPINPKVRGFEVIDTDFHFGPSWATLRTYLKEPCRSLLHH